MISLNTAADEAGTGMVDGHVARRWSSGRIARWAFRIATGLIMAIMTVSGVANIARPEPVVVGIQHLGYPGYFPVMLGVAKLLGVFALALPQARRLKEWAYAGFTFDLIAALVSHSAVGDGATKQVGVLVWLFLLGISYAGHFRRTVLLDVEPAGGVAS